MLSVTAEQIQGIAG